MAGEKEEEEEERGGGEEKREKKGGMDGFGWILEVWAGRGSID